MDVRRGISRTTSIVGIIVVAIIVGAAAYYAGIASTGGPSTVTSTIVQTSVSTSATTVTTSTNSLDPANVLACANKEGAVSIYGLVDTPDWNQHILPAWQAAYPNIKMSYLGLASGDLANKVLAEHKAGQAQSDVIETFVNGVVSLDQAGAILEWANPVESQAGYSPASLDSKNAFHPFAVYITTPIYNTKLLSSSHVPKSWAELLTGSAFKGKFAYSKPSVLGTGAGIMYGLGTNMSYSDWVSFMKQAVANSPILTEDDGASTTDVVNGQVAVGIAGTNDIQAAQSANATVVPLWLNPVFIARVPIAVIQNSPHPCSAKLFTEWATSNPGQLAVGSSLRTPWNPTVAQSLNSILLNPPASASLYYYDKGQYISNQTGIEKVFTQIFGA